MVKYLKKKKMFELLKQLVQFDCEVKLSDCVYRFYRGTEWLRVSDNTYSYDLCSMGSGNYLALDKYVFDEDSFKDKCVFRHVFNGCGKMEVSICV